ncbi:hypothetical protein [Rhizobium binae]|uniref:Uncharacterized protein n=1 Tax=Rhizobium binae TaxID=1138190 RepID=A0ABV2MGD3_9HYPH|nr:hypothetical protein [Rhizobium binae]NKL50289.1 hypothetical protein [Rhizobium leguminosarum bv. viciae]MBX4927420.1 hypothetical protein [Rhizobium binae]MBX4938695.1 hypothetical protein [Rhizobium binae]MBX4945318.1 hypothetical protein [Rhizobium binae]MBX4948566.1 hypothetical protein [Rhizobium binae]
MTAQRYSLCKNLNIFWTVFDNVIGKPAVIDGFVMDMLTAEEADTLVNLLNRGHQASLWCFPEWL